MAFIIWICQWKLDNSLQNILCKGLFIYLFLFYFISEVEPEKQMEEIEKQMLDMEMEKMDKTFKELEIYTMETELKLERMKDNVSKLENGVKTLNMDNEVMIGDLSEKVKNLK